MTVESNIEQSESTAYYVYGAILIIGAILGFPRIFAILLGIGLLAEGYLKWSFIPFVMSKFKGKSGSGTPPTA